MGGEVSEWYRKGRKGTCMKYKQTKQREKKKWVKNKGSEENKTWKGDPIVRAWDATETGSFNPYQDDLKVMAWFTENEEEGMDWSLSLGS